MQKEMEGMKQGDCAVRGIRRRAEGKGDNGFQDTRGTPIEYLKNGMGNLVREQFSIP